MQTTLRIIRYLNYSPANGLFSPYASDFKLTSFVTRIEVYVNKIGCPLQVSASTWDSSSKVGKVKINDESLHFL